MQFNRFNDFKQVKVSPQGKVMFSFYRIAAFIAPTKHQYSFCETSGITALTGFGIYLSYTNPTIINHPLLSALVGFFLSFILSDKLITGLTDFFTFKP